MRPWLIALVLAAAGCATSSPTGAAIKRQWRGLTEQQRPSFDSPGDGVSLSPTPDTGTSIPTDTTSDCSSCPPR